MTDKRPEPGGEERSRPFELRTLELRDEDSHIRFRGHAAVFNTLSVEFGGGWRERIAFGAFRRTLNAKPDVRFLYNHNPDSVMARTTNETLRLAEDRHGLRVEATLDSADNDVQRVLPKLRAGNLSQMSFGFQVTAHEWDDAADPPVRTLKEISLADGDVSVVTYPAYPDTSGEVRCAACAAELRAAAAPERSLDGWLHAVDLQTFIDECRTGNKLDKDQIDDISQIARQLHELADAGCERHLTLESLRRESRRIESRLRLDG